MKIRRIFAIWAIGLSLLTAGCNSFSLSPGTWSSTGIFGEKLNIQKRAILSGTGDPKFRVCAEPSPDAMSAMAMEGAGKGGVPNQVSAELSAALQQSAAFIGLRTTSIQLLRDFGYRLCEAYLSGAIKEGQYDLLLRRFQKNVVALLAIEQLTGAVKAPTVVLTSRSKVETSQSLFDQQAVREKVSEKIAELEKEKKKKQDEKDALLKTNDKADTTELTAQITAKEDEINRRKEDLKAIDKGIENARGTLAGGETQPTIHAGSSPAQPSDATIREVAEVVKSIAMDIVGSDDVVQLCLLALAGSQDSQDQAKATFPKWCYKELQIEQDRRAASVVADKIQLEKSEKIYQNPNSTKAEKEKAEKEIKDLQKSLQENRGPLGPGIYKNEYQVK